MDQYDETLLRIYGELLVLKPTIKWLLVREARRSRKAASLLTELSDRITAELQTLPMNENVKGIVQEGLDRMLADVLADATKKPGC